MRTIPSPLPGPNPGRPRTLTGPEAALVAAIMALAGALVLADLPMFGAMEFLGGAVYLACRTVKGLRESGPDAPGTI